MSQTDKNNDVSLAAEALGHGVKCSVLERGAPPLFIEAVDGAFPTLERTLEWVKENRETLDRLILEQGAIVLRGFPLVTAEHFNSLVDLFPAYERGYVGGGSPRAVVTGKVLEATQLAGSVKITQHSEMAYMRDYPPRIAFFGRLPAKTGGETTIASMREVTARLDPQLRSKLEQHGVRGVRNFAAPRTSSSVVRDNADNKGWDVVFGTDSRAEVEELCKQTGMEPVWNPDGSLTLIGYTDAFSRHPVTGELFYRSIIHTNYLTYENLPDGQDRKQALLRAGKLPTGYALGNGDELEREESRKLENIIEDAVVAWPWKAGDVMILDNLQVSHGRNPFTGERDTLVALLG
ncbi:Taurine catabolism dioxygenase TauD, TfdA family [compost metagenome]